MHLLSHSSLLHPREGVLLQPVSRRELKRWERERERERQRKRKREREREREMERGGERKVG